jgi:proteasome assembly chaperone (PAC2) family protein
MDDLLELREKPAAEEVYMIAGWRQWADGGAVSSALPLYLVEHLQAREIGRIRPDGLYLFQLPGMHDLLRPHMKLENGHVEELKAPENRLYYWQAGQKGLVISLGDEPQLNIDAYAEAFFRAGRELGVRRIAALGGVYAAVPFDKHRDIAVTYSLPGLRSELEKYAVSFSNYEGGASIGSYLASRAEALGIEFLSMYAMVPYYDLAQVSTRLQAIGIEKDYKAWHDVMGRLNHMFDLGIDLSELRQLGDEVVEALAQRFEKLEQEKPQAHVREYLARLVEDFTEKPFAPLDDVWERELNDLFGDEKE